MSTNSSISMSCSHKILFRVWSKSESVMYYGIRDISKFEDDPNYVIMQCIDDKDSIGVEVYEGDIIRAYDDVYCLVSWFSCGFTLVPLTMNDYNNLHSLGLPINPIGWMVSKRVVLGNIYENEEFKKKSRTA